MDKETLGERIRKAREQRGLSQIQLGKLVGKDQRAISEIESGDRKLAATELPAYATALEVSLLYFFEGAYEVTDLELSLVKIFRSIPSHEDRIRALQLVALLTQPPALPAEPKE